MRKYNKKRPAAADRLVMFFRGSAAHLCAAAPDPYPSITSRSIITAKPRMMPMVAQ